MTLLVNQRNRRSAPSRATAGIAACGCLLALLGVGAGPVGPAEAAPERANHPAAVDEAAAAEERQEQEGCDGLTGGFQCFTEDVKSIQTSGSIVIAALAFLGILGGGAILALGQPIGMKIMMFAGFSGGLVLIGNGVVTIFT